MIILQDVYNVQVHQFVLYVIMDISLILQIIVNFVNRVLKVVQDVLPHLYVFNVNHHTIYNLIQLVIVVCNRYKVVHIV